MALRFVEPGTNVRPENTPARSWGFSGKIGGLAALSQDGETGYPLGQYIQAQKHEQARIEERDKFKGFP
jgi:hypothetical protein